MWLPGDRVPSAAESVLRQRKRGDVTNVWIQLQDADHQHSLGAGSQNEGQPESTIPSEIRTPSN